MLRFPFDISWIGRPNYVLLVFVIEKNAIILVLNFLDIFCKQKLENIEFSVDKSKKIFQLDWNSMRLNT